MLRHLLTCAAGRAGRVGGAAALMAGLLLAGGCGTAQTEFDAGTLRTQRLSWDSVTVTLAFEQRRAFGRARPVTPDTTFVHLFDAAYDTLYAGAAGTLRFDDAALGDREPLLVEACGGLAEQTICEQATLHASPKRVQVAEDISYPEDQDFREGSYDLRFVVERRRFGAEGTDGPDGWERIEPPRPPTGYLLAYVRGQEASGAVKVPFRQRRGRFNLARYDGYDDFRYYLESELFDSTAASVSFDVYASLGGEARRLVGAAKTVARMTETDRQAVVHHFAQQAATQLVRRLGGFLGGRSAVVYVDDWSFDRFQRAYAMQIEVRWNGAFSDRERFAVQGELTVEAGGVNARFRRTKSNRRTERRWLREMSGDTVALDALTPLPENEARDAQSAAAGTDNLDRPASGDV